MAQVARALAVAALVLCASPEARACSVCGCGDPLLASSDPAAIAGTLRLQLDTDYLRVDAGTEAQPGYSDRLTQWSYRLNAVYRPFAALSLLASVPLLTKSIHTVGGGTDVVNSRLTGLGDVELGARYVLLRSVDLRSGRVHELAASVGSALPTGSHDALAPASDGGDAVLIDPHGQLGTGGFGPYAGVHYRFEQGGWLAFAALSYRLRTEAIYLDRSKYQFGDAVLWSVHGQYRPWPRLALDLGVDGRYALADRAVSRSGEETPKVDSTGGTVLSAAPGVYVNAVGNLWLFARGQVPFIQRLFGEQDVKPSFTAGFQYQVL